MKYTVYKTTNRINGKTYIGKHQTNNLDDGYMGSGKTLNHAINKYGLQNFEKDILFIFDTEDEMNNKEAELVTEQFCKDDSNYNICPGGKGGWGYVNQNGLSSYWLNKNLSDSHKEKVGKSHLGIKHTIEVKNKISKSCKGMQNFLDKTHSIEAKISMGIKNSIHQTGSGNSQFGSMWITNGLENKKIKNSDVIPESWSKGRKINPMLRCGRGRNG